MRYFFVVAVFAYCLASCKKDKDVVNPEITIVGKWYLKKYHTLSYKNDKLVRDTSRSNYTPTDFEIFNADGSGYTSNLTSAGETALIKYNYTLNGNTLMITQNTPAFYEGTYTIIQLTENTLEVTYESAIVFNGDHYRGIDNVLFKR